MNTVQIFGFNSTTSSFDRLDTFDDEIIRLTQSIQDIKDPGKVFTNFTQTFSLPASKSNNKYFKHFEKSEIVTPAFDARKKVEAKIELNSLPYQTGKLKLEGVNMKNGKAHTYRVTFFGDLQNLKDILGDSKLKDLDWLLNFNTIYNQTNIISGFTSSGTGTVTATDEGVSTTFTAPIVTALISNTQRGFLSAANTASYYDSTKEEINKSGGNLDTTTNSNVSGYYWKDLTFSIRVYVIIRAIVNSSITADSSGNKQIIFSNDFFSTTNTPFYKLYMLMQRKAGRINTEFASAHTLTGYITPDETFPYLNASISTFLVYGIDTATYINLFITVGYGGSGGTENNAFTIELVSDQGDVIDFDFSASSSATTSSVSLQIGTGTWRILFRANAAQDISSVQLVYSYNPQSGGQQQYTQTLSGSPLFQIPASGFSIQENIPDIKIIDFLSGLFKMFNLTAYKEEGKIYVKTLDSYYNSGSTKDITNFVDSKTKTVDKALPYKEITFKYEDTGNILAKQHFENNQQDWGGITYTGDETLDSSDKTYEIIAPFQHMKFENLNGAGSGSLQVGHLIDDKLEPYLGKPVLFYPIHTSSLSGTITPFKLQKNISGLDGYSGSVDSVNQAQYWIPSNSPTVDNTNADYPQTIHFNQETNEYTNGNDYDETLFVRYYQNYVVNVFRSNERLTKIKAKLPLKFLRDFSLANEVQIGDTAFRVNKITSNLQTGDTNLELLNGRSVISAAGGSSSSVVISTSNHSTTTTACTYSLAATKHFTGNLGNGTRLYDNSNLSTVFVGNGNYYKFTNDYVAQIDSLGYVANYQQCPSLTPVVQTSTTTNITYSSFTMNGNISVANGTISDRGFYWGTNASYGSNTKRSEGGTATGAFSDNITSGVTPGQRYYVTAYATNGNGENQGVTLSFVATTAPNAPTVVNLSELSVSSNSFTARLEITNDGGATINGAGFYMGTDSSSPTAAANNHYDISPAPNNIGVKSYDFSSLNSSTTYYYWGTATNTYSSTKGVASSYETVTTTAPVYTYNNTYYNNSDAYYACVSSSPQDYYSYDSTFGTSTTLYTTNTGGILSNLAPNGYYARDNYSYQVTGGNGTLGTQTACQTQTVFRLRITSDYPSTNYYDIETVNSSTLSTTNVLYMTAYIGSGRVCYSDEALTTTYTGLGTWKTDRGTNQFDYRNYPENKMFLARQQRFINGAWTDITSTATDSGYDDRICQLSSSGVLELVYYNYNTGAYAPTGSASITSIEIGNNNFANSTLACADTSTSKTRVYFTGTSLANGTRLWEDSPSAGAGSGTEFEGDGDYRKIYMPDGTTKAALVSGSGYISNLTSC